MKDYQKCYKMYCEAKKDIDEEPLRYEDWLCLEKEAERDSLGMSEERILRELLWICHGCPFHALYGDDGEMQCSVCGIDFKRMSAKDIEQRFIKINEPKIKEFFAKKGGG